VTLRTRFRGEAPLLTGIALGWLMLWLHGRAFVLGESIEGYGWPGYFTNAWATAHGVVERLDYFRGPLHGLLVGPLGERIDSYADAAVIVASCAGLLLVVAAGLGARALSTPWAGGLAALALPLTAHTSDSARWANAYPVLAASSGLCLAFSMAAARWPRPVLGLVAGLCGGLALSTDDRGLFVLPVALVLLLLATTRVKRTWLLVPLFVLGLASERAVEVATGWDRDRVTSRAQKTETQRRVVSRWIRISKDAELVEACEGIDEDLLLTPAFVGGPCSRELVAFNARARLGAHLPFGFALTGLGIALLALPLGAGWRRRLTGSVAVVGILAPWGLLAALTPMADRYLLQLAMPAATLPAAGLVRLAAAAKAPSGALAALALGAWVWWGDPADRSQPTLLQHNDEVRHNEAMTARVTSLLQSHDALLDCSEHRASISMLPRMPHDVLSFLRQPVYNITDASHCVDWVLAPPAVSGRLFVAVKPRSRFPHRRTGERVDLHEVAKGTPGWTLVFADGDFALWEGPGGTL